MTYINLFFASSSDLYQSVFVIFSVTYINLFLLFFQSPISTCIFASSSDLYQSVFVIFSVIYINLFSCFFSDLYQSVLLFFQWSISNCVVIFTVTYINLEDVTRKFRQPNILDVKVGRITYEPEAGEEKILHEELKYPHIQKTCFQTIGMMVNIQFSLLIHNMWTCT